MGWLNVEDRLREKDIDMSSRGKPGSYSARIEHAGY